MVDLWYQIKGSIAKALDADVNCIEEPDKYGDFAFACFPLAKKIGKSPVQIAQDLAKNLKIDNIVKIEATGSYINFYVDWPLFGQRLLGNIDEKYGGFSIKGKRALVEHTSTNPNASPHVGRARNGIIGDALVRLLRFVGYDTEVHYYVNDVGKQIAMLVYAIKDMKFEDLKFEDMIKIYIDVNKRVEENPEEEKILFDLLSKFEKGDKETMNLFKRIVSLCIEGQKKILFNLDIKFDYFDYESDYVINKKTDDIMKKLEATGRVFTDEDSRKVLDLKGFDVPMETPVLVLTRSNGTSLYQLRDLAYTIDKIEKAKDLNIIVLGEDQKLYFQQLSAALKLLGYEPPKVIHYSFVLLPTGKMSTRKGEVVLLDDFLKEAYERASVEIEKRYPGINSKEKEERSKKIAIGAVRYSMVKISPEKVMMFDWDEVLRFDGNTGPYLQYTYARANSILKKSERGEFDCKFLKDEKEMKLLKLLSRYPSVLERSYSELRLNYLSSYMYELADMFNQFYQTMPVLKEEANIRNARLKLVEAVKYVLSTGLNIIGVPVLDEM